MRTSSDITSNKTAYLSNNDMQKYRFFKLVSATVKINGQYHHISTFIREKTEGSLRGC